MTIQRRGSRRAPTRRRVPADVELEAVRGAMRAVAEQAAVARPETVADRNRCEGYETALRDLAREVQERIRRTTT